jgi:hypothetical protein
MLRRRSQGASAGLLRELESEDRIEYRSFIRINTEQFDFLFQVP